MSEDGPEVDLVSVALRDDEQKTHIRKEGNMPENQEPEKELTSKGIVKGILDFIGNLTDKLDEQNREREERSGWEPRKKKNDEEER